MKISLDPSTWQEPRFDALRRSLNWGRNELLGVLVRFWHATREKGLTELDAEGARMYLPVPPEKLGPLLKGLIDHAYLSPSDTQGVWQIAGNKPVVDLIALRRKAGKVGGLLATARPAKQAQEALAKVMKPKRKAQSESLTPVQEPKPAPCPPVGATQALVAQDPQGLAPAKRAKKAAVPTAHQEANRQTWEAYREAYVARYGVEPLRNARVNAQVAQFVLRIGQHEAQEVIRFFVLHPDPGYVRGMHPIGFALRDAEALWAQWCAGHVMTPDEAQSQSQQGAIRSQLARIEAGRL